MPSTSSFATEPIVTPRLDELDRLTKIARMMDSRYKIAGIRFGWDTILGLIPGVGDTLTMAPSLYILAKARKMGASNRLLAQMIGNIGIDWIIGWIPLLGDLLDVGFKSNRRNVELLHGMHGLPSPFRETADQ
ncbi:DUF4112 domain-containing protein [Marivivens donghaensis]|uniref:DUF4112 domain-containing protein n=1 Tax=Marivivens donghaensis TaxID=1699413 RepID=A0ABX0VXA5_9RHOB|nr:DUF4112 domain-containing protein [Marivivens donghaensis]NIY72611.1 DUF4112 domain-containing protein [Marivivens donghaensis]